MQCNIPSRNQHRFSTMYKPAGTESYRLAATQILGFCGDNAQNKSKDIRYLFVPDGYSRDVVLQGKMLKYMQTFDINIFTAEERKLVKILIQIDQAGAEALIVAYICKPGKFRDLFLYGIKPHTYAACNIFRDKWRIKHPAVDEIMATAIREIKKHPSWKALETDIKNSDNEPMRCYYIGKKTIHGANYDMRGNTMASAIVKETDGQLNLSGKECDMFLTKHHALFPEIRRDFHCGVVDMASNNRKVLRNLFGFPREFTGRWDDKTFREMYAFIPQSTVGTITNIAITEVHNDIIHKNIPQEEWGLDILQNGHDSMLVQCYVGTEKEVAKYLRPHIERDLLSPLGEKFKMKSEIGVGFNWKPSSMNLDKKTNEWVLGSNPLGLQDVTHWA